MIIRQMESILAISPPLVIADEEVRRVADAVNRTLAALRPDGTFRKG